MNAQKARQQKRPDENDRRIDHQPFEPGPDDVAALVMIGQQGEDGGKVVALRADFEHLPIEIGQLPGGDGLAQGHAFGQSRPRAFPVRRAAGRGACRRRAGARRVSSGMPSRTMAASCWLKKENSSLFIGRKRAGVRAGWSRLFATAAARIPPARIAARPAATGGRGFGRARRR